jgi:PTH2 family peptidyl-tRNA hydrolase
MEEEIQQYIIVRSDLKIGKGKLAAQVAHASLQSFLEAQKINEEIAQKWLASGAKKIVVKVENEEELKKLYAAFKFKKIPCSLIEDAGLTQIPKGTITALGIGPWYKKELEILKNLKLL